MRSLLSKVAIAVVTIGVLFAAPARATTPPPPPPVGQVDCDAIGTLKFSPGITNSPSTKAIKVSGKMSTTNCLTSLVTGGKYPISSAVASVHVTLPIGTSCSSDEFNPVDPKGTSFKARWIGLNPKGKPATVATSSAHIVAEGIEFLSGVSRVSVSSEPIVASKPTTAFPGQTLSTEMALVDLGAFQAACATKAGAKGGAMQGLLDLSPAP
jgi:hypothetical protein